MGSQPLHIQKTNVNLENFSILQIRQVYAPSVLRAFMALCVGFFIMMMAPIVISWRSLRYSTTECIDYRHMMAVTLHLHYIDSSSFLMDITVVSIIINESWTL
mmetsp:Transcript_16632/g.20732  ORF Transcript_16632/g.20732 Transcript_16632/m.20732 type:complete len:103 (-) Transcript_16632:256-564(-)